MKKHGAIVSGITHFGILLMVVMLRHGSDDPDEAYDAFEKVNITSCG